MAGCLELSDFRSNPNHLMNVINDYYFDMFIVQDFSKVFKLFFFHINGSQQYFLHQLFKSMCLSLAPFHQMQTIHPCAKQHVWVPNTSENIILNYLSAIKAELMTDCHHLPALTNIIFSLATRTSFRMHQINHLCLIITCSVRKPLRFVDLLQTFRI